MPYPRIHITNVRGHGIPPCPLCVFPRGCVFSHRMHLGGYGIPAIPTPPSANPPTEFTEFTEVSGGEYSPTEFTEFTEISGVEEPPTDFADAHRWLGCVRFCGKIVWCLRGYGRMPYPPDLCTSVQSVGEYLASETSVVSVVSVGRLFGSCVGSPTEFTEFTEASGGEEPPTDFTDAHRWLGCVGFCGKIVWCLRGYGRDAIPS